MLSQPFSPYQLRSIYSPFAPAQGMISPDFREYENPFENVSLQQMFDVHPSIQAQPQIQQFVIKHSRNPVAQGDFKVVQMSTQFMTPQKSYHDTRRYQSERIEKRQHRIQTYSSAKDSEQHHAQRSQKGLRNLSLKVKDIVIELKLTTYKDVAERLIQALAHDGKISDIDNSKDEQNIKRRVYDALNVMIASSVLRKEGKKVLSDTYTSHKGKSKRNEKECIREEINRKQVSVNEKKKRLSELYTKILSLQNMVTRNKTIEFQDIETKFQFPLLIFQDKMSQVKFLGESKSLKIFAKKKPQLSADLDILVQMEIYNTNAESVQMMPQEITQYLVGPIANLCQRYLH